MVLLTVVLLCLLNLALVCSIPIPQCAVYCEGEILKAVQEAGIFADSKTFVDMPMKYDPEIVIENFKKLEDLSIPVISKFLMDNFLTAGSEIMSWTPIDWDENPRFVQHIRSDTYKEFAMQVHGMWKALGKQQIPDVNINPQRYSMIPQKNPFIVPGERFHEFYYWDSYWIIRGLITSGMIETAKGILLNAIDLINEYGFIPNGARVYYLTRSQPPFLSEMVRYYYEHTQDIELLKCALPALEIEYKYWMETHSVELPGGHVLNRFYSREKRPRPESYREDMHHSKGMTEEDAQTFFSNIIAGAESGEDFTARWFAEGTDIRTISTREFIPVGLNSIMYKFESNMDYFNKILQRNPTIDFALAMTKRKLAIETYLWNQEAFQWYDYSLSNNSQIIKPYPSNWFPVWAGAYDSAHAQKILESLQNSGLLQIGGVLSTHLESGQQWDAPNTWAPHQSLIVQVLETLNTPESKELAETVASRWIYTTYLGYQSTRMMHEKYNALIPGASGSGGEYPPQIGFGWTNGVTIEFLSLYG